MCVLRCIKNNDNRELLLSFTLTAANLFNKLTAVRVKFNSSLFAILNTL